MSVALFGGTFNPVHFGHLNLANTLGKKLQVQSMRMIPCAIPPHRETPSVSAEQRLTMLELATANQPLLRADNLELQRDTLSYSIDTVKRVRQEIGETSPLYLCLGIDALLSLNTWHQWTKLLDYCHIVACSRPRYLVPNSGALADWITNNQCDDLSKLKNQSHGCLHLCKIPLLDVSSTAIRNNVKCGERIDHMTSNLVVDYIKKHSLYE